MEINLMKIIQPIGEFYLGKISAKSLVAAIEQGKVRIEPRKIGDEDNGGVQRELSKDRISEIRNYTSDIDATFPTPIIIAINSGSKYKLEDNTNDFYKVIFDDENNDEIGDVIDGQHRLRGLMNSENIAKFELPIVLMFNLTLEEKAYVFSIINSKQTKVNTSLIYDLFGLSEKRSPQKTCHEIARLMNSDQNSPFYKKLKMLGKKNGENETLSQGTFVKQLITLISKNADSDLRNIKAGISLIEDQDLPLRKYFIQDKDEYIYKILVNVFSGLKANYSEHWDNTILSKTVVYGAVIRSFYKLYKIGSEKQILTKEFFEDGFSGLDKTLSADGKKLLSDFVSGSAHEASLCKYIIKSFECKYEIK